MMRPMAILMTGVILLAVVPTTYAGQFGSAYLSVGGSQPLSQLGDQVKNSFTLSAGYGFIPKSLSTGDIELVGRLKYEKFPASYSESNSDLIAPDISFFSLGLDFKLNLSTYHLDTDLKGTNFFLLLGSGYNSTKWSSYQLGDITVESISESALYISPGVGAEFGNRSIVPYLEMRFIMVSGKRIGDYQSLGVNFGVKI